LQQNWHLIADAKEEKILVQLQRKRPNNNVIENWHGAFKAERDETRRDETRRESACNETLKTVCSWWGSNTRSIIRHQQNLPKYGKKF
jgi:hypothetical protein